MAGSIRAATSRSTEVRRVGRHGRPASLARRRHGERQPRCEKQPRSRRKRLTGGDATYRFVLAPQAHDDRGTLPGVDVSSALLAMAAVLAVALLRSGSRLAMACRTRSMSDLRPRRSEGTLATAAAPTFGPTSAHQPRASVHRTGSASCARSRATLACATRRERATLAIGRRGRCTRCCRRPIATPGADFAAYAVVCLTAGEEDDFDVITWRKVWAVMKTMDWPQADWWSSRWVGGR